MPMASSEPAVIWRRFARTAEADPSAIAVSTDRHTVTRATLAMQASAIADAMRDAGVCEHDVVTLALPNGPAFVASFLAITRLSAVAALASTRYRDSELHAICASVRPQFVLVEPACAGGFARVLDVDRTHRIAVPGTDDGLRLLGVRAPRPASALDVEARFGLADPGSPPALIKCSSGSTGAPKAVLWTHANVRAAARNVVHALGLGPGDAVLAPVPLSHSYGFDLAVLPMIWAGTSLVVRDGFAPKSILADLAAGDISVFLGVPEMYRVLNRTRQDPDPDLSSVRHLLSCTAPLPVACIDGFRRRFNASICQHYGSSETGGVTLHTASHVAQRPASVGRAMRDVVVRVVGPDGDDLPAGCRGEIVIGGAATAAGYVGTASVRDGTGFRDGHYRTGDRGHLDADGFLHLDGSRRGVIHVGGWKVTAAEVAQVLESHPAVDESAVTAMADRRGRNRVVAAVTLRDPADEQDVISFCQARLADYKVPRRVHILDELPRTASGEFALRLENTPA